MTDLKAIIDDIECKSKIPRIFYHESCRTSTKCVSQSKVCRAQKCPLT